MSAFLRNVGKVSNAEAVSLKTRFGRRRVGGKLFRNLGPLRAVSASTGGDPYFASVVSLLHMNGTDASTTFSDAFRTWTAGGNAQIDTAQSVFGGASGLFDGTTDFISASTSTDFDFGTGDWTVEFRFRFAALEDAFLLTDALGSNSIAFNTVGNILQVTFSGGTKSSSALTAALDTWYAIAISRVGNTLYFFENGLGVGTASVTGESANFSAVSVHIGANAAGVNSHNGWVDEWRATKGVGRYSANYTVDTAAFPDS